MSERLEYRVHWPATSYGQAEYVSAPAASIDALHGLHPSWDRLGGTVQVRTVTATPWVDYCDAGRGGECICDAQ